MRYFCSIATALALLALPASAPAAPNAAGRAVADPPAQAVAGARLTVRDNATLTGSRRAVAVRYYLSRDGRRDLTDLRLRGRRTLRPGARGAGRARVEIPHSLVPGDYRLLACADDTGVVRDRAGDDCAASRRTVAVADNPNEGGPVRAFADTGALPDDGSLPGLLGLGPAVCPRPGSTRPPSLERAIADLQRLLASKPEAREAGRALRRRPEARSAEKLESVAAAALPTNNPGLALAALLRAHGLRPRDPSFLVNAATVATGLGRGRDALALLDAADRLDARASEPMGINPQAVALNAHGHALLALGRFADAERFLTAATAIDPLLREAELNLAVARFCARKPFAAVARRGLRRASEVVGTEPPVIDQTTFDISQGVEGSIPELAYPPSFDAGVAQRGGWKALAEQHGPRVQAHTARVGPLRAELTARLQSANRATRRRSGDILAAALGAGQLPGIRERLERAMALLAQVDEAHGRYAAEVYPQNPVWIREARDACGSDDSCFDAHYRTSCQPVVSRLHAGWLGAIRDADAAVREAITVYYPVATGLAANLSDPAAHQIALEEAARQVDSLYIRLVDGAARQTAAEDDSVHEACSQTSSDPPPSTEAPRTPGSAPCPDALGGSGFFLKFEVIVAFELIVRCEQVSLSTGVKVAPGLSGFGRLTWDPRSGSVSVFAGAKGGGSVEFGAFRGEAAFRSGVYVTIDRNGGLTDAGFRAGPSANVTVGGQAGLRQSVSDEVDFSVAGVFGAAPVF